ncbi:hypothetical protein HYALB_00000311 [Hymenoscyphus albidus]|uniref:Mitotic checkpoint regulator, MAD2B-interacting-domain-containing protein n=1 Tax=Hymenoscyphus albidus TaxID=595503 RepID=A0A9N9LXA2_9HELO|nr:hypothetical protein HYALB_00000311 [Hymenoscyphus albidus]
MALVDYSDTDESDVEESKPTKPISNPSKPAFQKVVDRSNSGKIKVSLPQSSLKTETPSDGPPSKRIKTSSGGAFSGFNSFLPPPKRAGQPSNATLGGGAAGKKSGLGVGVNLKTGAAPGFSRATETEREYGNTGDEASPSNGNGINLPPPKAPQPVDQVPADEVKLVGKPLMFRPMSVARKPKKKTASQLAASTVAQNLPKSTPAPVPQAAPAEKAPKLSLFSLSAEDSSSVSMPTTGEYEPMIHESQSQMASGDFSQYSTLEPYGVEETPNAPQTLPPAPTTRVSQSLDDIAGDLQLSAAERRQLFGRQKGKQNMQSATKIINFNTDEEYLHNEELRASGEQVKHNPVRSIAPGKHSLKQLVNAAQSQKEALEESFQTGKNNRKEASSRYGW